MKMDVHVMWDDGIKNVVNSKDLRKCGPKWRQKTKKFQVRERVKMWWGGKWYFGNIVLINPINKSSSLIKIKNKPPKFKLVCKEKCSNRKIKMAHTVFNADCNGSLDDVPISEFKELNCRQNIDDLDDVPLSKFKELNCKENIDDLDNIPLSRLRQLNIQEKDSVCQDDIIFPKFEKNIRIEENVFIKYEEEIYDVNSEIEFGFNTEPLNSTDLMPSIIKEESEKEKHSQAEVIEEELCSETEGDSHKQEDFNIVLSEPFTLSEDFLSSEKNLMEVEKECIGEEMKNKNDNLLNLENINKTDGSALSHVKNVKLTLSESRKRQTDLDKSKKACEDTKPKRYRNCLLKPCSVIVETNIASQMKNTDIYKINHKKILSGLNSESEELSQITNSALISKQLSNKPSPSTSTETNKVSPKKYARQDNPKLLLQSKTKPEKDDVLKNEGLEYSEKITTIDFINHNFSKLMNKNKSVLQKLHNNQFTKPLTSTGLPDKMSGTKKNESKDNFPLINVSNSIHESTLILTSPGLSLTSSSLNVLKSCVSLGNTSLAPVQNLSNLKKVSTVCDILATNSNLNNIQRKCFNPSNTITELPSESIETNHNSSHSIQESSLIRKEANTNPPNLSVNYTSLRTVEQSLSDKFVTPKKKLLTTGSLSDITKCDILNSSPYSNEISNSKLALKCCDSSNTITELPSQSIHTNHNLSDSVQEHNLIRKEANTNPQNLTVNYTTLRTDEQSLSNKYVTPKKKLRTTGSLSDITKCDILNSSPYCNKISDSKIAQNKHVHNLPHSAFQKEKDIRIPSTVLECLDGAPPFIREVFECENIREGFIKTDLMFVLSLIPDIEEMTDKQKMNFKLKVIDILNDVLDDPQLQIKRS